MAIKIPTTDEIGSYVRDMLGDGDIDSNGEGTPCAIEHVDDSDLSNLRLITSSGAEFWIRITRKPEDTIFDEIRLSHVPVLLHRRQED